MKRILFTCLLVISGLSLTMAQHTNVWKYDVTPWPYDHVFLDYVKDFKCRLIDIAGGQYVGQTDSDFTLYGYGQYIRDDGDLIIGKFRQGTLIQGISLGKDNVTVGSRDFYCSYSLTTGRLEYVYHNGKPEVPSEAASVDYTFMTQTFSNGDSYVGEMYRGKRHGLGIYYYASGGLWFGSYEEDTRQGFGAWFRADNAMVIGLWKGEDEERSIYVPQMK